MQRGAFFGGRGDVSALFTHAAERVSRERITILCIHICRTTHTHTHTHTYTQTHAHTHNRYVSDTFFLFFTGVTHYLMLSCMCVRERDYPVCYTHAHITWWERERDIILYVCERERLSCMLHAHITWWERERMLMHTHSHSQRERERERERERGSKAPSILPALWGLCVCVCACVCVYIHTHTHTYLRVAKRITLPDEL